MNKPLKLTSLAVSFLLLGSSALKAQDFNLNGLRAADVNSAGAGKGLFDFMNPPKPQAKATKEWTVMVFMNADPAFTNEQLSDFMMNWYRRFMADGMHIIGPLNVPLGSVGATPSTVRPQALNDLPPYLNAFANAAMANNEAEAVKKTIASAVRFSSLAPDKDKKKLIAPYVDLYDFAAVVGANAAAQDTKQAASALMDFIKTKLVMRSVGLNTDAENGYDYTKVGGIAINMTMKIKDLPASVTDVYETKYPELSLSQASQWDEFVAWADGVWRK
ncbi:MAG: hypothetical protein NTY45_12785 [Elusimicrobia bacterium]|nr:hypothetical protein [Elusimicrobiota bacterium]